MKLRFLYIAVLLFVFGCGGAELAAPKRAGAESSGEYIKVEVLSGLHEVIIKGSTAAPEVAITIDSIGLSNVNGVESELPLTFNPSSDYIHVNGKPYRGTITVFNRERALHVVDELPVEHYLVGLINKEISSSWSKNALKTQAVIARTYALHQKRSRLGEPFHLKGTHEGQVYTGAQSEDAAAYNAVRRTSGEVLTYGGELALTVYHSNAGGRTEAAVDVWGGDYPYLRSVKSPHDKSAPRYKWESEVSGEFLRVHINNFGYEVGRIKKVVVKERSRTGRVIKVLIRSKGHRDLNISGEKLRKIVGYDKLRSTLFKVKKSGNSFRFKGNGSGHGVGLSQWGAKGMSDKNSSYKKILQHYYPGTKLKKLY